MWCSTCSNSVLKSVERLNGVTEANLNFATKLLSVTTEGNTKNIDDQVRSEIESLGFSAKRQTLGWIENFHKTLNEESERAIPWLLLFFVGFMTMWSSMFAFVKYQGGELSEKEIFYIAILSCAFGVPAILAGSIPFAMSGLKAAIYSKLPTLDLFIFIGGISAISISVLNLISGSSEIYTDSGAMIITILLLSKKLEMSTVNSLSQKVLFNINAMKRTVLKKRGQTFIEADNTQIKIGDIVSYNIGDTVSFDGDLISEVALLDEHLLSGEPTEVEKRRGHSVLAGAIARSPVHLKVNAPLGHRNIDHWLENSIAPKRDTDTSTFNKIEANLFYFSLIGASLLAFKEYVYTQSLKSTAEGFFVGILIFCPCLFALIVPMMRKIAISTLMKNGVEMLNSAALSKLANVNNFYFDKTGTLESVNSEYISDNPNYHKDIFPYLALASNKSNHPIVTGLELEDIKSGLTITKTEEINGEGTTFYFSGGEVLKIGKHSLLKWHDVEELPTEDNCKGTPVAFESKYRGFILSTGALIDESKNLLRDISRDKSSKSITILSGDPNLLNGKKYEDISNDINYIGNLSPEEKSHYIREHSVFVGDGLNDTPAQNKADVSVRIKKNVRGYSPVDFHIMSADISKLGKLLRYSRKYQSVLRQTFILAFTYNLSALCLAFVGIFSPLGAVIAMTGSTALLFISASRITKFNGVTI